MGWWPQDLVNGISDFLGDVAGVVGDVAVAVFAVAQTAVFVVATAVGSLAHAFYRYINPTTAATPLQPVSNTASANTGNYIPIVMGTGITSGIEVHTETVGDNKVQTAHAICLKIDGVEYGFGEIYTGEYKLTTDQPYGRVLGAYDASGAAIGDYTSRAKIETHTNTSYLRYKPYWLPTWGIDGVSRNEVPIFSKDLSALVETIASAKVNPQQFITGLKYEIKTDVRVPGFWAKAILTTSRLGVGLPLSLIDQASFDSWDLYCNETVNHVEGRVTYSGKRFEVNGCLSTANGPGDLLTQIGIATHCTIKFNTSSGKVGIIGNRPITAIAANLNSNNILRADINVSREKPINQVQFTYLSQDSDADGKRLRALTLTTTRKATIGTNEFIKSENITGNLVSSAAQAARIAQRTLNIGQRSSGVQLVGDQTLAGLEAGDLITYTDEVYGYLDKQFIVQDIRGNLTTDTGLTFEITLKEYDVSDYVDNIDVDPPPKPSTPTLSTRATYSLALPAPTVYGGSINSGFTSFTTTVPAGITASRITWRYYSDYIYNTNYKNIVSVPSNWTTSNPQFISWDSIYGLKVRPTIQGFTSSAQTDALINLPTSITFTGVQFARTITSANNSVKLSLGKLNATPPNAFSPVIEINFRLEADAGSTITVYSSTGFATSQSVNLAQGSLYDINFTYDSNTLFVYLNGTFAYSFTNLANFDLSTITTAKYAVQSNGASTTYLFVGGLQYSNPSNVQSFTTFNTQLSGDIDGYFNAGDSVVALLPRLDPGKYYIGYQYTGYQGTTNWSAPLLITLNPNSYKFQYQYLITRFATSAVGSNMRPNPFTGATYIGFLNTSSLNTFKKDNPSYYTWQYLGQSIGPSNRVYYKTGADRVFTWVLASAPPDISTWTLLS